MIKQLHRYVEQVQTNVQRVKAEDAIIKYQIIRQKLYPLLCGLLQLSCYFLFRSNKEILKSLVNIENVKLVGLRIKFEMVSVNRVDVLVKRTHTYYLCTYLSDAASYTCDNAELTSKHNLN